MLSLLPFAVLVLVGDKDERQKTKSVTGSLLYAHSTEVYWYCIGESRRSQYLLLSISKEIVQQQSVHGCQSLFTKYPCFHLQFVLRTTS